MDQTASSETNCRSCGKEPRADNPRELCIRCYTLFKNPRHYTDLFAGRVRTLTDECINSGDVSPFDAMGILEMIAGEINSRENAKREEACKRRNRELNSNKQRKNLSKMQY